MPTSISLQAYIAFITLLSLVVHGVEDALEGAIDASWYGVDVPMQHADPLISTIDELTAATTPNAGAVVRAVYEAAGEDLPTVESFKESDLGESVIGSKHQSSMEGLRRLLAGSSSKSALGQWVSLERLDTVLGTGKQHRHSMDSQRQPSAQESGVATNNAGSGKASSKLDHSAEFSPDVFLQLQSSVAPPTASAIRTTLAHLQHEQHQLKRESDEDMDVAEITSSDADLQKGLKEVEKLKAVDYKLKLAKRRARELEQLKEGREPARDMLTERNDLEDKVEDRLLKERLRRLSLHEENVKKKAYDAQMRSSNLARDVGKHGVTEADVQRADAVASLVTDKAKTAEEALEVALGDNKDLEALSAKGPGIKTLHISKTNAQKLATKSALKAEHSLNDALLTDEGFDKAAKAAEVALAYENTADKVSEDKMQKAKSDVDKTTEASNNAMVEAIHTGTTDAYMRLRDAMARHRDAKGTMQELIMRRKMEARLKAVGGAHHNPSVILAKKIAGESDAAFYKNVKQAERAYADAEESGDEKAEVEAGGLVHAEEKADERSSNDRLQVVKLQTTVAATRVADAQKEAETAIKSEHEAERNYRDARRHAWNAITAKEAAQAASERSHEQLSAAQDKLADVEATTQTQRDRHERLNAEKGNARRSYVAANAIYLASKHTLKRREDTLKKLRKETSKDIAAELQRLSLEVETLQKSGHEKMARQVMQSEKNEMQKDSNFVKREETRELDERIDHVKQESAKGLAEDMNQLVEDETQKLKNTISDPDEHVQPAFEVHSKQLDAKLAELSAKTEKAVREKIKGLSTDDDDGERKGEKTDGQHKETAVLDSMFQTVAKFQAANNQKEMAKQDGKFVVLNAHKAVRTLKKMQTVADKPLAVAEEELQKIIKIEGHVKEQLSENTYEGQAALRGKAGLDQKFTNAKRALKLAKQSMDGASSASSLKRSRAKMEAAKKLMQQVKLAKVQNERKVLDQKMSKVNAAMATKRSAIQKAADSAAEALHTLKLKDIERAKTKILRAQIRHDRWTLQNMEDKLREDRLESEHAQHKLNDIGKRTDDAHWAYTRAKRQLKYETKHVTSIKENADKDLLHQKTAIKIAHLTDEHYKETFHEVQALKKEALRKENLLKTARKDLKGQEKIEQQQILDTP